MAQTRKKKRRRQAVRDETKPMSPLIWVGLGMLLGLGLAVYLVIVGLIPTQNPGNSVGDPELSTVPDDLSSQSGLGLEDDPANTVESVSAEQKRQYDFHKILSEMEVIVPDTELRERVRDAQELDSVPSSYVIQAGSFAELDDAESMKARLALLGLSAQIETVEIKNRIWHRVRSGPYASAREVDQLRRRLRDNALDVLVLNERS